MLSDILECSVDNKWITIESMFLSFLRIIQAGAGSRFPGMNYVVFPGNVGDADALLKVAITLGVAAKGETGLKGDKGDGKNNDHCDN